MDALLQLCTGSRAREEEADLLCLSHSRRAPLSTVSAGCAAWRPGTGKSTAMRIACLFAFGPLRFSAKGSSDPAFRDKLAESNDATALIEEADSTWKGHTLFESLLSDRYHRDSAKWQSKYQQGRGYVTKEQSCFGASIVHRRTLSRTLRGRSQRHHTVSTVHAGSS